MSAPACPNRPIRHHGTLRRYAPPLFVAFAWGMAFVWIREALESFDVRQLVELRLVLSAVGFATLFALRIVPLRLVKIRDLPRATFMLMTGVFIYHIALNAAQMHLPASIASLIGQTMPLFVVAFTAGLQRIAPDRSVLAGILIASLGTLLIIARGGSLAGPTPIWAVVVCILAPCSLGAYTIAAKPLTERYGAVNLTGQVFVAAGVIAVISALANPALITAAGSATPRSWLAVMLLAAVSTVGGYTAWSAAVRTLGPTKTSLFNYLVPIVSLIAATVLLGEVITPWLIAGGILVLAGVAIGKRAPATPKPATPHARIHPSRRSRASHAAPVLTPSKETSP